LGVGRREHGAEGRGHGEKEGETGGLGDWETRRVVEKEIRERSRRTGRKDGETWGWGEGARATPGFKSRQGRPIL